MGPHNIVPRYVCLVKHVILFPVKRLNWGRLFEFETVPDITSSNLVSFTSTAVR